MFLGKFDHTLDEKSRLTLPARYRARLADGLVIMSGTESCLLVYPMDEFQTLFDKLSALPMVDPQAAVLRRLLFMNASDVVPDKQNRIVVPQTLREHSGITGEAVVVGVGRWIELWSPADWAAQQILIARQAEDREALARFGV